MPIAPRLPGLKRAAASAVRLQQLFEEKVVLSIPGASRRLDLSQPTVTESIRHLERLGIVREMTGRKRNRVFVYDAYMKILEEGTEPIR